MNIDNISSLSLSLSLSLSVFILYFIIYVICYDLDLMATRLEKTKDKTSEILYFELHILTLEPSN